MNKNFLPLFALFFVGIFSGGIFARIGEMVLPNLSTSSEDQRAILLTLVEDMSAKSSEIHGIWMTIEKQGELYWLPIYPTPLGDFEGEFSRSHDAILIDPSASGSLEQIQAVRDAGIVWTQEIRFDQAALSRLVEAAGFEESYPAIESWGEPQMALANQIMIINEWCQEGPDRQALDLLLGWMDSDFQGLSNSFSWFESISLWDIFFGANEALECHHMWVQ